MNRRKFFALIAGVFAARFLPAKPKATDGLTFSRDAFSFTVPEITAARETQQVYNRIYSQWIDANIFVEPIRLYEIENWRQELRDVARLEFERVVHKPYELGFDTRTGASFLAEKDYFDTPECSKPFVKRLDILYGFDFNSSQLVWRVL